MSDHERRDSGEEEEEEEDDDIPENFFDDFTNNDFLEELVDAVPDRSQDDQQRSTSPMVAKCLQEIDKLTRDIQKRKRKLEKEIKGKETNKDKRDRHSKNRSRSHGRKRNSISKSPVRKYPRSRSRSRSCKYSRRSPDRRASYRRTPSNRSSPPRSRRSNDFDNRSRPRGRSRSRSRSRPSGTESARPSLTFLEELAKTFAERGQEFPEKNLLLNKQAAQMEQPTQQMPLHQIPLPQRNSHPPQMQMMNDTFVPPVQTIPEMYGQPFQIHYMGIPDQQPQLQPHFEYGRNYSGINPMAFPPARDMTPAIPLVEMEIVAPPPPPIIPILPKVTAPIIQKGNSESGNVSNLVLNKKKIITRCEDAIKVLRAFENKVPIQRFLHTRTTMPVKNLPGDDSKKHALINDKNVYFELTSSTGKSSNKFQKLTGNTKQISKVLGFAGSDIFNKIRMKTLANKVIKDIEESHHISSGSERTNSREVKKPELINCSVQTVKQKCEECSVRDDKVFANKGCQMEPVKMVNMRTQTIGESFREPLLKQLSNLTSGQLVAMSDFAKIIVLPMPSNAEEMYKLREGLMDTYNLSQRDDETVRRAERDRANNSMDMNYSNNNFNMPNNFNGNTPNRNNMQNQYQQQQLSNEMMENDGSQFFGRGLYSQMDGVDLVRAEEQEREREQRLQQIRYEEDMRLYQQEEQQRLQQLSANNNTAGFNNNFENQQSVRGNPNPKRCGSRGGRFRRR